MQILNHTFDPDIFFQQIRNAPRSLLCLDYDGTLAPFTEERDRAFPYPGIRELITSLMKTGRTRVVIVSGRAIDHLLPLLGLETPPEIWGSHGREVRHPDGSIHFAEPDTEQREGLTRALELIQTEVPGEALEIKPASLAVHCRGMSRQDEETLMLSAKRLWEPLAEDSCLQLHPFDGGLELRAPGVDKGTAIANILEQEPESAPSAYLGDDMTDEDAFNEMKGRGVSILVRSEIRPTAADVRLTPPEELIAFLNRWCAAVGGDRT